MATKRWVGNSQAVADTYVVAVSGTVISQVYSAIINGKSISYSASGTDVVSDVLNGIVNAWNASSISEFSELTALALPTSGPPYTSATITGDTAGVPAVITYATTGGATFSITNTTPATGPNFFNVAANWSTNTVPANSDVLIFDDGNVDCLYGINSALTGVTLIVQNAYSGKIGLPLLNRTKVVPYYEYRPTFLTLAGGTVTINALNLQRCNLAFGANATTIRVLNTSTNRLDIQTPIVLIIGGDGSSELDITKGDVATAFYQGTTASFTVAKSSYATQAASDANLYCGSGTTLTTLNVNGGNIKIQCNVTTITANAAGGIITLIDAAAVTTINMNAGTLNANSTGTIGTLNLYGSAYVTFDGDPRAKTITNPIAAFSQNVTITDTQKSVNSGTLTISGNGVPSLNVNHGGITTATYV